MNTLFKGITAIFLTKKADFPQRYVILVGDSVISISVTMVKNGFVPDRTIDGRDKLITAGLVNSHTHSYMSLFRNSADDLMFHTWLFDRIMPMEDKLTAEDMYYGTQLACLEMIKTGTTAFLDMNIARDCMTRAMSESGLKATISRGLVGNGRDDEGGKTRIEDTLYDMRTYGDNKRLKFMMGPHAIYTTDRGYLELVMEKAEEYGLGINIHLQSVKEIEDSIAHNGCSPVKHPMIWNVQVPALPSMRVKQLMRILIFPLKEAIYAATNLDAAKLRNGHKNNAAPDGCKVVYRH